MNNESSRRRRRTKRVKVYILRILRVLLVTLLAVLVFLVGVVYLLSRGPSVAARDTFVRTVRETSAIGFLSELFLTPEELDAILHAGGEELLDETDTSLVEIVRPAPNEEPTADAWGYTDEDGDGLILVPIKGAGYVGYMLIVLDPSRVVVGCDPSTFGWRGYTVEEYVAKFDAVAGINAGGFDDPGGNGNGSVPDTAIVSGGNLYFGELGVGKGYVGIDADYKLHVGFRSVDDIRNWNIQEGCGFTPGPVLVINGEMAPEDTLASGLNPRTAIGQRSDGAMLLLVIEGRQPSRLGATYQEEAEIMLRFGAVNACNMDGGSSSMMWLNGEYINNTASVVGIRALPTSFVVLKEGRQDNG